MITASDVIGHVSSWWHASLPRGSARSSAAAVPTFATALQRQKADPSRPPKCGGVRDDNVKEERRCGGVPSGWAPFLRQGKQGRPFRCQGKRDDNVKKGGSSGEWL
jgi:hypothetical protein